MAYGAVHETFWDDPKMRALTEHGRMLMLYLLTCRHRNRLGCFVLDPHYAAADVQWPVDEVKRTLAELADAGRIEYDAEHRVVLIPRYLKHNPMPNPNVAIGASKELKNLPQTPLVASLANWVEKEDQSRYSKLLEALRNRLINGSANHSKTVWHTPGSREPEPVARTKPEPEPVASGSTDQPATDEAAQTCDPPMPTADPEAQASEIIRAANHGMVRNDRIDSDRFRPIETVHGSRSYVLEWLKDGIPFELILQTVADRARAYQPSGRRQQIGTMKYFEAAVRDEWERRQALPPPGSQAAAIRDEYPGNGRADRRTGFVRFDDYDPEKQEEERQQREASAIAAWCREHPDDAAEVRDRVATTLTADSRINSLPEQTVQTIVESRIRDEIWQRMQQNS